MKRRPKPVVFSHEEPPQELLRFTSPNRHRWDPEEFASFLRAREAWRDTHVEPLPILPSRERIAMDRLDIPAALVDAEDRAPRAVPEWRRKQLERGITDPRQVLSGG